MDDERLEGIPSFTLITTDVRIDRRGHAVLVIGDHDLIFLGNGRFKRGNIYKQGTDEIVIRGDWDGEKEEEHGLYRVVINPEYWRPYTYRNTFPNFEKGEAETLAEIYERAVRQAEDYAERGWEFRPHGKNRIGKLDYLWTGWKKDEDGGDKPPSIYGDRFERGRLRADKYKNKVPTFTRRGDAIKDTQKGERAKARAEREARIQASKKNN